ncbi:MAG: phage holin family protein [Clostridia bacterium]|nr:phage holin family protein [Clostridia bacterium]
MKNYICTILGIVGGFIAQLFGGWTEDIITLIILMTIDFVMGIAVAGVFHKSSKSMNGSLDSRAGWRGLCKKGITLMLIMIAHRLDVSLGTSYIKTATVIGFIANEVISIVENAGVMGIPLPKAITRAIDILKHKENE